MSSEKLIQWMRTRLSDPNAVAQRQARNVANTVEEKLLAEIRTEREARLALERRLTEEREQTRRAVEGERKARSFVEMSTKSKDSHPLTAGLVARHGEQALIAFANQFVAPLLREGYDLEELHDHVEQLLDEVQVPRESATPGSQTGKSHPAKNGADQPTTLSNRDAAGRESVTEDIPWSRIPRADRVKRLKRDLGGDS